MRLILLVVLGAAATYLLNLHFPLLSFEWTMIRAVFVGVFIGIFGNFKQFRRLS